jgi:hypothetical protein
MKLNIDIDNVTLDIFSERLKHVVSPLDILKWFSNFEKEEIKIAKDILSNMTVYTTYEIEEILNNSFYTLYKKIKLNKHLIVHPVGEFGKSGSIITYLFQKTAFYKKNHTKITLLPDIAHFEPNENLNYSLILIDDFIGSGKTIEDYYLLNIDSKKLLFDDINFVGVAGLAIGLHKIKPYFNEIKIPPSNIFKKIFSSEASYFGYRKHENHRDLAYKYGIKLSTRTKTTGNKLNYIDALGYENSQALVSFSYGSPNNTLPIIWANKDGWLPLIPRFSTDKISTAKNFRKNISYELSILKEFGSDRLKDNFFSFKIQKGKKIFSSVNHIDFSIYSIIKLSREGFTDISICQKLGILSNDYEDFLTKGKERGIFENGNKLTLLGLELFKDAKKCIENRKKSFEYELKESFNIKKIDYIPKQFNGKS